MKTDDPQCSNSIIVMGASAGGIDAIRVVLSGLPIELPAPVLVVQHLSADSEPTRLADVLGRHTPMPVRMAREGYAIETGTVWVAEPDKHLKVRQGCLVLEMGEPVRFVRPSVNVLFASAARHFGSGVIGVVLTGIGSDGADGCRAISDGGGTVVVQDPETAAFSDMPAAAIKTGTADHIVPLDGIADKLLALLKEA